jgi:serine/threonine protein kinase/tetratricopeptide (TPR) repeat protein
MDCPKCRAPNPDTQAFCGQCGFSLQSASPPAEDVTEPSPRPRDELETGTTFAGRYQIIEELGRGGMGRVYKVIDKEVHAKVALKLIRPEIAADRATIDRFRQELKTAREISHKNICRMYDLGRDAGTYYLTMEYVSGQDLKSMIAMSGQLGVGTALSIAKQVCEGLAEAHRLGIVHRDLKPQNIQIDKGGHAKIMDFGIARSVVAKGLTDAGVVIGTPQYMSPEQVEAKEIDVQSDLYSLGIIIYEMLTGRVPFDGDTPLSVAMKHKLEQPRDPRELNAAIPPDLDQVILKCLEKDKSRRYQSAEELHRDLVRIEQGLPTTEQVVPQQRPTTSREITVHFTMRQLLVPALVVVAVLAVAIGAWRLWPRRTAPAPSSAGKPTLAVLYFENISGDSALETWRTGLPELIITSLSQSRLLNVVSGESIFSILKKLNLADAKRYSAEDLARVAQEGQAQYLLTGSVMKAGKSTVITTRLQAAATGEVMRAEKLECASEEEILSKVEGLTKEIKADLNLAPQAIAADIDQPLGEILTSSPEALKYYTEARRFHLNGANQDAIRLYERAIDADPGFAMAYRAMAAALGNIGETEKRAAAAKKALELSDRLPERLRYEIQITAYHASQATWPQAIDACNKLLAKYPDDTTGLNYLANIYDAVEQSEKALPLREHVVSLSPTPMFLQNRGGTYFLLGRFGEVQKGIERAVASDPKSADPHDSLASFYVARGQFEAAEREAEKASPLAPQGIDSYVLKGDVARLRGDYAAAEREYLAALDRSTGKDRDGPLGSLADLYAEQGRTEKAREELKTASQSTRDAYNPWLDVVTGHPDRAIRPIQTYLETPTAIRSARTARVMRAYLGVVCLAAGDVSKAQKLADDLNAERGGLFDRLATRMYLTLAGAIAAKRGDARTAVSNLEQAVQRLPVQADSGDEHAVVMDLLAQAYSVAGDLEKARQTYEMITTLTTGRLSWGDIYARSYYRLGLIAEHQGDKSRARENFQKFLSIWKDADPIFPEIADAKKRLR